MKRLLPSLAFVLGALLPVVLQQGRAEQPPQEDDPAETDIFGRPVKGAKRLGASLLGLWQLMDVTDNRYPKTNRKAAGYILFTEGYLALEIHMTWQESEGEGRIQAAQHQSGIQTYKIVANRLQTASLIGSAFSPDRTLFSTYDRLVWEPPGMRRNFTVKVDGSFLTLRRDDGSQLTFARRVLDSFSGRDIYGRPDRAAGGREGHLRPARASAGGGGRGGRGEGDRGRLGVSRHRGAEEQSSASSARRGSRSGGAARDRRRSEVALVELRSTRKSKTRGDSARDCSSPSCRSCSDPPGHSDRITRWKIQDLELSAPEWFESECRKSMTGSTREPEVRSTEPSAPRAECAPSRGSALSDRTGRSHRLRLSPLVALFLVERSSTSSTSETPAVSCGSTATWIPRRAKLAELCSSAPLWRPSAAARTPPPSTSALTETRTRST